MIDDEQLLKKEVGKTKGSCLISNYEEERPPLPVRFFASFLATFAVSVADLTAKSAK